MKKTDIPSASMAKCEGDPLEEGGDLEILAASLLLHDCVEVPKDSPLRSQGLTTSRRQRDGTTHGSGLERKANGLGSVSYRESQLRG
jgi:hypothetical protein